MSTSSDFAFTRISDPTNPEFQNGFLQIVEAKACADLVIVRVVNVCNTLVVVEEKSP